MNGERCSSKDEDTQAQSLHAWSVCVCRRMMMIAVDGRQITQTDDERCWPFRNVEMLDKRRCYDNDDGRYDSRKIKVSNFQSQPFHVPNQ